MSASRQENRIDVNFELQLQNTIWSLQLGHLYCFSNALRFQRRLDELYPQESFPFRASLAADNERYRQVYLDALAHIDAPVLLEAVVGSVPYGIASPTVNSDIDATILIDAADVSNHQRAFDSYLEEQGIVSNVLIANEELLKRDDDTTLRAILQLALGTSLTDIRFGVIFNRISEILKTAPGLVETLPFFLEKALAVHAQRIDEYWKRIEEYRVSTEAADI
ncbi:MAG: hypothetical protein WC489_04415 [Patescibacteria group bacterium]